MTLNADKLEIQKHGIKTPAEPVQTPEQTPGTLDFYRAVRDYRYNVYAPWFDQVVRFEEWQDKDVLEIGVGLGSDHFRFARGGNRMNALDLSQEHLRQTQRHLELEGLTTTPVYGDAEKMPFADESFDLVYAFGVLHHTPDTEAAVAEIHRILRPGGVALISYITDIPIFFYGSSYEMGYFWVDFGARDGDAFCQKLSIAAILILRFLWSKFTVEGRQSAIFSIFTGRYYNLPYQSWTFSTFVTRISFSNRTSFWLAWLVSRNPSL
jgi:SAM-dependent methyltransferase